MAPAPLASAMNPRKHMLEAFQASRKDGDETDLPENPEPGQGTAGGPFAPEPERAGEATVHEVIAKTQAYQARQRVRLALTGLMVVLAFLLGRMSVGTSAAAGPGDDPADRPESPAVSGPVAPEPEDERSSDPEPPPVVPTEPGRGMLQRQLVDDANRFTIQLISYPYNSSGLAKCDELADHFWQTQGIDLAWAQSGSYYVVLAGAAGTRSDLDELLGRIRGQPGPPPASEPAPFDSALIVAINRFVRR